MNKYIFDIKCPIKTSMEGMMLGNGTLGALVYSDNKLTIALDRIDLWDHRLPDIMKSKDFNFATLVDTIKKDYEKCYSIFDSCYNHPYPTKINAGKLVFDYETTENESLSLNMKEGNLSLNSDKVKFNMYIDANKDVMVISYSSNLKFDFVLPPYFYKKFEDNGLEYSSPIKDFNNEGFVTIQPMYKNHSFEVIAKQITTNGITKMYLSIFKENGLKKAKKTIDEYILNENKNFKDHLSWWDSYFATSDIITPDEGMNSLYIKGKYYFGCNSRKNYPMTLHGVWTRNNGELPPWKADLHNDLNVQMTYEGYLKAGNYKEGKVVCDYFYNNRKAFKKFAKKFMHSNGYLIPGVMSQNGTPLGGWPQYSMNPACSIWVIKCFKEYYEYTGDIKFLKTRAMPIFKETEKCIRNILVVNAEGNLELPFHASPEYYENDPKSVFKHQTNFELTMLKYLYSSLIEFCAILKQNSHEYEEIYSHLSSFYRNENDELMISLEQDFEKSHRHFSHMLCYKNMALVNPIINKELIEKDINRLLKYGTSEWVGFSFVELAGLYASINNGEDAYKYLKIFEEAFIHENGFHMNNDFKHLGYSDMTCYVMTLEANEGYVSSLNDMMVKSYKNLITVFPAITNEFKSQGISFTNLRVHNNHLVSAEYKNGQLNFSIKLSKLDKIMIENNIKDNPTIYVNDEKMEINCPLGEVFCLEAEGLIEYRGE